LSRTALHPFGHVRFQAGKSGDPWGFVGNEEDRGSGISDFHARPYRAELGVFLAVDPLALLSLEKTIGSAARLFAYAYAASDPITQSDPNGLTFGDFARGMWDQGVESAKNAAKGAYSAAKSTAAQALRGDIAGAGMRVVKGVADGLDQTIDNVVHFGDDFAKATTAGSDYESGRLAVKPVTTAMGASALILGPRVGSGKTANAARTTAAAEPAPKSPTIKPQHLMEKTPNQLRQFAKENGLVPHATRPDKFMDPVTGKERLRLDPGHVDRQTGLPYDDPQAAAPHAHAYEPDGKTKVRDPSDNNPHFPTQ